MNSPNKPHLPIPPMTLPLPATSMIPSTSQLFPPPPQWQVTDHTMGTWLQAKSKEDQTKQEEEKTRQECLRLEQRKIEHSMLREAIQARVPPHLLPLIFMRTNAAATTTTTTTTAEGEDDNSSSSNIIAIQSQMGQELTPLCKLPSGGPTAGNASLDSVPAEIRRDDSRIAQQQKQQLPPLLSTQTQAVLAKDHPVHVQPSDCSREDNPIMKRDLLSNTSGNHSVGTPPPQRNTVSRPPPSSTPTTKSGTRSRQYKYRPSIHFRHWVPPGQPKPGSDTNIHFRHWVPPGQTQATNSSNNAQHGVSSSSSSHSYTSNRISSSPGRKRKAQDFHQPTPPPSSPASASVHSSNVQIQASSEQNPTVMGTGQSRKSLLQHYSQQQQQQQQQQSDVSVVSSSNSNSQQECPGIGQRSCTNNNNTSQQNNKVDSSVRKPRDDGAVDIGGPEPAGAVIVEEVVP